MSKRATAAVAASPAATLVQTSTLQYLPMSTLAPGHEYPGGGVNARKYGRGEAADLIPTLREFGVIVPFVVRYFGGVPYVVDGNRRLAGLEEFVPPAARAAMLIPTIEQGTGNALEIGMLVNSQRLDLHPVDRFEVFAVLVQGGATLEDIARRYVMKVPQVRQALSLAKLAPEVREAWRGGRIDGEAAEAFALTSDQDAQRKVLKRLGKNVSAWQVRNELGAERHAVGPLLGLVGRDAYEKAGHHVNVGLFTDEGETVSDVGALRSMAGELLAAKCEELKTQGWAWALAEGHIPGDVHAWRRVYPAGDGSTFAKDVMAQAGCLVRLEHPGKLRVERGFLKPGAKVELPKGATTSPAQRKVAAAKKAERAEKGSPVTNALAQRLSQQVTNAVATAIADEPDLALCAVIAFLACAESPSVVTLKPAWGDDQWRGIKPIDRDANAFAKYLRMVRALPTRERLVLVATWAAQAVDLTCSQADDLPLAKDNEAGRALLSAFPAPAINAALRGHFDAADYFASMSADAARSALKDMGLPSPKGAKKSDLAKLAAGATKDKKWLPPEMRVPGLYDGPGAALKAAAKPAKPARAARKKRRGRG